MISVSKGFGGLSPPSKTSRTALLEHYWQRIQTREEEEEKQTWAHAKYPWFLPLSLISSNEGCPLDISHG